MSMRRRVRAFEDRKGERGLMKRGPEIGRGPSRGKPSRQGPWIDSKRANQAFRVQCSLASEGFIRPKVKKS